MNGALWIAQGLLALAFLAAAYAKLSQTKEKLLTRMAWAQDFSPRTIKAIGTLEALGAVGLILPALVKIAPVLTPLAALGLALVMVGAAVTHARRREFQMIPINVVLLLLALFVAWGRFGSYAL